LKLYTELKCIENQTKIVHILLQSIYENKILETWTVALALSVLKGFRFSLFYQLYHIFIYTKMLKNGDNANCLQRDII
jgi:hypothetical protein